MVYRGRVENFAIRLEDAVSLPEGAEVRVEIVTPTPDRETETRGLSLYQRLKPIIGAVKHLLPDASVNVDHYLYGHPKK